MADDRFFRRRFVGITPDERATVGELRQAFQTAKGQADAARVAMQEYEAGLRQKYDLAPTTTIDVKTLEELQAEDVTRAAERNAEIAAKLDKATPEEKAKHAAWVAAGKPDHTIHKPT